MSDFHQEFPDNDACPAYLMNMRFPRNIAVVRRAKLSGSITVFVGGSYNCDHCGIQISPWPERL